MVEIICIGGLVGSGKDSVADSVAEKLKFQRVRLTPKDVAQRMGITIMEYQGYIEKNLAIDKEFDKMMVKEARKSDSVVSTWLGPWMIKEAALRVWLETSPKARAERISKRDEMSKAKALKHVNERDMHNRGRYMALYSVDIYNHSHFDLIINTENYSVDQIADIVVAAYRAKEKK